MKLSYLIKGSLTLALAITSAGAMAEHNELIPNILELKPGDTVKATKIPSSTYLRNQNDPDDIIWNRVPAYGTLLLAAPPVHQSVKLRFDDGATRGKYVYFQVARTDERMYVRLRWKDETEDRDSTVDGFRDGVAVQFALNGDDTSYMMGSGPDNPVNIWYWRADQEKIENLAAGGYGSTTLLPDQSVTGDSRYVAKRIPQDNTWQVVMSRPIKSEGEHDVNFERETVPMGFAVWQGNDEERDGNKRVTHTWINLEPGIVTASKK